ncbi:neprilysin-like [Ixodes scapularis]
MPASAAIIISSSLAYVTLMLTIHFIANTIFPWCAYSSRCFKFDHELRASIDSSVDPCDNFYGHVCGRWTNVHPTEGSQLQFLQKRTLLWLLEAIEKTVPSPPSSAVDKIIAGYQKCLAVFRNGNEKSEAIRRMFEPYSYEWPSLSLSTSFDFLDFTVGLALDYGIHVVIGLESTPYLQTDQGYSLYVHGLNNITDANIGGWSDMTNCIRSFSPKSNVDVGKLLYQGLVTPEDSKFSKTIDDTIRKETQSSFQRLSWMDAQTLLAATDRLTKITGIHGSPSHLLNMTALNAYYDYLPLFEKPFVEDLLGALSEKFNMRKRLFGSQLTVSREDMEASMIEVNAFYAAMFHTIVIKTGLIQPPLIDLSLPHVVSYGGLGRMIGHELSHAFDPQRYNFSYRGGKSRWYSDAWDREFHSRLHCLSTQINEAANSRTLGKNTLDESFADSVGMEKAILAYQTLPKGPTQFGYTQDQMFFVAGCFGFCSSRGYTVIPASIYPPPALRCNLPAMNLREFGFAFKCAQGTPMNPIRRCSFYS